MHMLHILYCNGLLQYKICSQLPRHSHIALYKVADSSRCMLQQYGNAEFIVQYNYELALYLSDILQLI